MRLLSFDPSSTCTGYAVFNDGNLAYAGFLKPNHAKDDAYARIREMGQDLIELLREVEPDVIVLEVTSGKTAGRLKKNASGLPIYGVSIGYYWAKLDSWAWAEDEAKTISLVKENEWTNSVPKLQRIDAIDMTYPEYDRTKDPGGDIADAIGLADWWLKEEKVKNNG